MHVRLEPQLWHQIAENAYIRVCDIGEKHCVFVGGRPEKKAWNAIIMSGKRFPTTENCITEMRRFERWLFDGRWFPFQPRPIVNSRSQRAPSPFGPLPATPGSQANVICVFRFEADGGCSRCGLRQIERTWWGGGLGEGQGGFKWPLLSALVFCFHCFHLAPLYQRHKRQSRQFVDNSVLHADQCNVVRVHSSARSVERYISDLLRYVA